MTSIDIAALEPAVARATVERVRRLGRWDVRIGVLWLLAAIYLGAIAALHWKSGTDALIRRLPALAAAFLGAPGGAILVSIGRELRVANARGDGQATDRRMRWGVLACGLLGAPGVLAGVVAGRLMMAASEGNTEILAMIPCCAPLSILLLAPVPMLFLHLRFRAIYPRALDAIQEIESAARADVAEAGAPGSS